MLVSEVRSGELVLPPLGGCEETWQFSLTHLHTPRRLVTHL